MLEEAGKLSQFDSTHKTGKSIRDQIKDGSIYEQPSFGNLSGRHSELSEVNKLMQSNKEFYEKVNKLTGLANSRLK